MSTVSGRLDRWLWAVRVFKTRSLAKEACVRGSVRVNNSIAKPALRIKTGDRVTIKLRSRVRELEVTRVLEKRVGPSLVSNYYIDHSPLPDKGLDASPGVTVGQRDRGAGRPTKRDRRLIDKLRRG